VQNVYFELTTAFNRETPTVVLASGQAVVFYRTAIMSKDGDWVIKQTPGACERVLTELERRGARYRVSAPLDVRWLSAGWSSHFEFFDEWRRRIRCDFVSRPPRVPPARLDVLFESAPADGLLVVDLESLILMKRTKRAKDYAVIGELAAQLPPQQEIELTTDVDRIVALASVHGALSSRPSVQAARAGGPRRAVVSALVEEMDHQQQLDAARLDRFSSAAQPFMAACRKIDVGTLPLREAHAQLCEIAAQTLPTDVEGGL
jgi:hypothetical protein